MWCSLLLLSSLLLDPLTALSWNAPMVRFSPSPLLEQALGLASRRGWMVAQEDHAAVEYRFQPSVGMYKRVGEQHPQLPDWLDPIQPYEAVLDKKGWSFLQSGADDFYAYDIEAEVEPTPWQRLYADGLGPEGKLPLSSLGYSLELMTEEEVERAAQGLGAVAKGVLLEGRTEPKAWASEGFPREGEDRQGIYAGAIGGLPLFSCDARARSTSGWPSFSAVVSDEHVVYREDTSHGMTRTEVLDARSGCHIGHRFSEGSSDRFCINASALRFLPAEGELPPTSRPVASPRLPPSGALGGMLQAIHLEKGYLAGGCYHGMQVALDSLPGVWSTLAGHVGPIEAVEVAFDPGVLPYTKLLTCFMKMHNPQGGDKQGYDWGPKYQASVFCVSPAQEAAAKAVLAATAAELGQAGTIKTLLTRIGSSDFVPAEEEEQRYSTKKLTFSLS
ncbi:unnamed protein product [Chrysoparadoxa australica]